MNPKMKYGIRRNAPTILTILGCVGALATGVVGFFSGMRAERILHENGLTLKDKEAHKLVWKEYVITVMSALATTGCIIAGHKLTVKQIMALSGIAAAGSAKFNEYRGKMKELIGEEKEKELYEEVKKKVQIEWVDDADFMRDLENSGVELEKPVRYYDDISDQFFDISPTRVLAAKYHLNKKFWIKGYVSLNYWYELLGVEPLTVRTFGVDGDNILWTYDKMLVNNTTSIEIFDDKPSFTYKKELPEGTRVLRYEWWPTDLGDGGAPWEGVFNEET